MSDRSDRPKELVHRRSIKPACRSPGADRLGISRSTRRPRRRADAFGECRRVLDAIAPATHLNLMSPAGGRHDRRVPGFRLPSHRGTELRHFAVSRQIQGIRPAPNQARIMAQRLTADANLGRSCKEVPIASRRFEPPHQGASPLLSCASRGAQLTRLSSLHRGLAVSVKPCLPLEHYDERRFRELVSHSEGVVFYDTGATYHDERRRAM